MFKNKEEYLKQREGLVNKAQKLFDEGKYEDSIKVKDEVDKLDNDYEKFALAQANLKAIEDKTSLQNIVKAGNKDFELGNTIESFTTEDVQEHQEQENKEPSEYKNAWAKMMMGKSLTKEENKVMKMMNEYTHTTGNSGVLIPTTVIKGIFKEIEGQYPLWNDVFKTNIPGKVALLKSISSSEAKWYDEATSTEEGKEEFAEITLDGCELARDITVSWKLKKMAVEDFIPFIQSQLAEKIGAALGYGVAHGKGKPGQSESFKAEPMGIITQLEKDSNSTQVIEYTDTPAYTQITEAIGKIKGSYKNGACVYANGTTIWSVIANISDSVGKPYFVANPIEGGVGTLFGKIVKEDDSLLDGEILIGNANRGYHANINENVLLDQEDHKKERKTDYLAYGIVDGGVRTEKAFSLLKKKVSEGKKASE